MLISRKLSCLQIDDGSQACPRKEECDQDDELSFNTNNVSVASPPMYEPPTCQAPGLFLHAIAEHEQVQYCVPFILAQHHEQ